MKNILVPFNFTKPAINALRFALSIAEKSNGIIHLIHVIELPTIADPILMPIGDYENNLKLEMREKINKELANTIAKYNTQNTTINIFIRFGNPIRKVLEFINDHRVDVIMIGGNTRHNFTVNFSGLSTEKLIRRSPVPVIVIKNLHISPVTNIVFPLTQETVNQVDLIRKVKNLQKFFNAHLHVVWINTPMNFTSDTASNEWLSDFAGQFTLTDYTIHIFNHHNEEDGILEFTKMINANLIAMGTHGRKGFNHFLHGSVAESIISKSERPIWTYTMTNIHEIAEH